MLLFTIFLRLLVLGLGHVATLQQFDALMAIPGLDPKMVTVTTVVSFAYYSVKAKLVHMHWHTNA